MARNGRKPRNHTSMAGSATRHPLNQQNQIHRSIDFFEKYAYGEAYMSPEQLQKFLAAEGSGGSSLEDAEKIVDEVLRRRHHIAKFTRRNLTIEDFNYFLFSTDLNPPIGDREGMFRANGGCGYVKKPDFLMNLGPGGQVFDPNESWSPKKTLKVKVYMGDGWHRDFKKTHFDLYSPPDFFVRVGIAGAPADETMEKTKVKCDTWTPVWNEEFTFRLTVPELALLRVEAHEYDVNEKDDFGGQTCLPVSELRQGIRAVPLFNRKGEKYSFTRLLMRFEFI